MRRQYYLYIECTVLSWYGSCCILYIRAILEYKNSNHYKYTNLGFQNYISQHRYFLLIKDIYWNLYWIEANWTTDQINTNSYNDDITLHRLKQIVSTFLLNPLLIYLNPCANKKRCTEKLWVISLLYTTSGVISFACHLHSWTCEHAVLKEVLIFSTVQYTYEHLWLLFVILRTKMLSNLSPTDHAL